VQVACRDVHAADAADTEIEWPAEGRLDVSDPPLHGPQAMLRRPFSLAGRRDTPDGVELDIIHRVVGIGTEWLSHLTPGDEVSVLGPLGNRFDFPSPDSTALLVGGGVGIPPMLYLAEKLAGRKVVAFAGALTRELLPLKMIEEPSGDPAQPTLCIAEFARHGIPSVITTDDGSAGIRGFVTQALEHYLDQAGFGFGGWGLGDEKNALFPIRNPTPFTPHPITIYTCGPEPMMKRVAQLAASRGIECQVAVERAMACGMGTCQSCCIRVMKSNPQQPPLVGRDWCYRLACTDGPVFRGADLLW